MAEGFVWLSLTHIDYASLKKPAAGIFLFFAQNARSFVVLLSIYLIEKKCPEKKNTGLITSKITM